MKTVYTVTAIGVGIDTEVHSFDTYEAAKDCFDWLKEVYYIDDAEEMYKDCIKGFSSCACDIELEIHKTELQHGFNKPVLENLP